MIGWEKPLKHFKEDVFDLSVKKNLAIAKLHVLFLFLEHVKKKLSTAVWVASNSKGGLSFPFEPLKSETVPVGAASKTSEISFRETERSFLMIWESSDKWCRRADRCIRSGNANLYQLQKYVFFHLVWRACFNIPLFTECLTVFLLPCFLWTSGLYDFSCDCSLRFPTLEPVWTLPDPLAQPWSHGAGKTTG